MEIQLPTLDQSYYQMAQEHLNNLTKPRGSLGYLEEIAKKFVLITENITPALPLKKVVYVFAGDHGVVEEGVSAYPQEVTKQMIFNFIEGGAGINVIARQAGADVYVVDVGVAQEVEAPQLISRKVVLGTRNFLKEPAMTRQEAEMCIKVGLELAKESKEKGYQLLIPGDMGIGNTTPSAAVLCALLGEPPEEIVGRGTGIDDQALARKRQIVAEALQRYHFNDPIDVLAKVGGAEIGAIAGLFLGGAMERVPVVIDGFISLAGFTIAYNLNPRIKDFVFCGHCSKEKGAAIAIKKLGLRPILDLDMRLGEGTGAALASIIIETSLRIFREMATFEGAGVSKGHEVES